MCHVWLRVVLLLVCSSCVTAQNKKTKTYSNSLFLGSYQYLSGINAEFNINWCHWVPEDLPACSNPKMSLKFISGSGIYAFHHIASGFNEQCATLTFDQKQSLSYRNYSSNTFESFDVPSFTFMTTGRFLPVNCLYIKSDNAPSSLNISTECDCIINGCPGIICDQSSTTQAPTASQMTNQPTQSPTMNQPSQEPTSQIPNNNINGASKNMMSYVLIILMIFTFLKLMHD